MVECVHGTNIPYAPPVHQALILASVRPRQIISLLRAWLANNIPSRNLGAATSMEFQGSQKVMACWPGGSKKSPVS